MIIELEKDIESFINQAMQTWNVPGLALVIVKDDEVLAKGYGIREMDKPDKVDEQTLFAIGSNTKPFTSTAMGLLVQDGKVAWDDPVTKYLPTFKMYDPHATAMITSANKIAAMAPPPLPLLLRPDDPPRSKRA